MYRPSKSVLLQSLTFLPLLAGCAASASMASGSSGELLSPREGATAAYAGPITSRLSALMPRGLTTIGTTVLDGKVYVLGGYFGRPHAYSKRDQSKDFHAYSLDTGTWEKLPSVGAIQSSVLATDGSYVYRIGGMRARNAADQDEDMHSVNEFARFDPKEGKWQDLAPMSNERSSHQAVIVGSTVYVMGGWELSGGTLDHEWREDMLSCDLSAPSCEWKSEKMPFDTRAMGATVHQGKIYVLGGLTPEGSSDAVHIYDVESGRWTDGPSLPDDNLTIRAASWRGRLYANGADGKVYRLTEDGASWEKVGALQFPRMFHQMVATKDGLIALGGIPSTRRGGRMRHMELLSNAPKLGGVAWTLKAESTAKNRQGAFLVGQKLYVFGGNNSVKQHDFEKTNFVNASYSLDLGTLQWSEVATLPVARQSMLSVVAGTRKKPVGLAIGGFGWSDEKLRTQADIFAYNFSDKTWNQFAGAMPEARSQFGLAQWEDMVWLFGGLNYDASRGKGKQFRHPTTVLKLDPAHPESGFSEAGFELKEMRRAFAGGQLGSHYYLTGGLAADFASVATCRDFDLATRTSKEMACPSAHRLGGELIPLNGKLYLVGGSAKAEDGKRAPTASLEVYNPQSNAWSQLSATLPLDNPSQVRAFAYEDQLLLYSANREDGLVQVALLDPEALASGHTQFVNVTLDDPTREPMAKQPATVASPIASK